MPKNYEACRFEDWSNVRYARRLEGAVPALSGVYAIIRVERLEGLPTSCEIIYIGQSINLRRRYAQHLDDREPNGALLGVEYVVDKLEFWWTTAPRTELNRLESRLIRTFRPKANRRLYGGTQPVILSASLLPQIGITESK